MLPCNESPINTQPALIAIAYWEDVSQASPFLKETAFFLMLSMSRIAMAWISIALVKIHSDEIWKFRFLPFYFI